MITKEANAMNALQKSLDTLSLGIPGQTMHSAEIDMDGLTVCVEAIQ